MSLERTIGGVEALNQRKRADMRVHLIVPVGALLISLSVFSGLKKAHAQVASPDSKGKGLHGFVCGPAGKPLQNTVVSINTWKTIKTSEDGTFFVPHKELEPYNYGRLLFLVQGEHEGKPVASVSYVDYVTGKEHITFRLWRTASIYGQVVAPDGTPIREATVSALIDVGSLSCHGTSPIGKPASTDEQGRFRLEKMYPATKYRLRVTCPERERKMTDWVEVGNLGTIKVVLRDAPGFVAGRVVDQQGNAAEGVRVIMGHPCIPDAICVTDVKGRFRIEDLVPGEEVTVSVNWNFQEVKVGSAGSAGSADVVLVARSRKKETNSR